MDANRCKDIRVGSAQNHSHCASGRYARYVNTMSINRPPGSIPLNFLHNPGNNGGFAPFNKKLFGVKTVPNKTRIVNTFLLLMIDKKNIYLFVLLYLFGASVSKHLC